MYDQGPRQRHGRPTSTIRSSPSCGRELSSHGSSFSWLIMTNEDFSASDRSLDPFDGSNSASFSTHSNPSSNEHCAQKSETPGGSGSRTLGGGSTSEIVLFRDASPKFRDRTFAMMPSFSVHPSLRFPSIPRALPTPLSFLDPELLQISDAGSPELDLSLYVVSP